MDFLVVEHNNNVHQGHGTSICRFVSLSGLPSRMHACTVRVHVHIYMYVHVHVHIYMYVHVHVYV